MRRFGKWAGRALLLIAAFAVLAYTFGPREPVETDLSFDSSVLGPDLDLYLKTEEARFNDITPGVQKQIVWAGAPNEKTRIAIVYVHGWSATSQEIRPVPDLVAKALGANLFYTRLAGHGRPGQALADAKVQDWFHDMAEARAIGHRLGDRVLFIGTSTGGTLVSELAAASTGPEDIAGVVLISPNYRIKDPLSFLLTQPFARQYVPLILGETRTWTGKNPDHTKYWTSSYPSVAVLPLGALVRHTMGLDYTQMKMPALFVYNMLDQTVDETRTAEVAAIWGGGSQTFIPEVAEADKADAHVITGDIISPTRTQSVTQAILVWVRELNL